MERGRILTLSERKYHKSIEKSNLSSEIKNDINVESKAEIDSNNCAMTGSNEKLNDFDFDSLLVDKADTCDVDVEMKDIFPMILGAEIDETELKSFENHLMWLEK
jgi:hypothetical protein